MNQKTDIKSEEQFKLLVRAYFPNCEFKDWRVRWVRGIKVLIGEFSILYGILDFGPPEIHIHNIWGESRLKNGDYYAVIPAQQRKLVEYLKYLKCKAGEI